MKRYLNMLASIAHIRSQSELLFNLTVTFFSFLAGYFNLIVIDNINLFMAVFCVVFGDWMFGSILALRNGKWETRKALNIVWYLTCYWVIVFIVLTIEKAHPSAFFMSEAIVMPILMFQVISMLKNASLLGVLPQGLLLQMLKNIDSYKESAINDAKELNN